MSNPFGNLLHNLINFGHWLRALGVETQPDGVGNLVKATAWIPIDRKQDFRPATRSLLIRRQQDLAAFDQAFDQFWQARKGQRPEKGSDVETKTTIEYEPFTPEAQGPETMNAAPRIRYSPAEAFRCKDFAELGSEEVNAVKPLLTELKWKLG